MKLARKFIVTMLPLVFTHVVRSWLSGDHEEERRTIKKKTTKKLKTSNRPHGHGLVKSVPNNVTQLRRKNEGRKRA